MILRSITMPPIKAGDDQLYLKAYFNDTLSSIEILRASLEQALMNFKKAQENEKQTVFNPVQLVTFVGSGTRNCMKLVLESSRNHGIEWTR